MKAFAVLILISLVVSLSILAVPVKAQEPLTLIIKPDGSISPSTSLLERNGTTYTFTGDIFGTIWVQTDNIIIDGAGLTLQGNGIGTGQNTEIGILLGGPDLSHRECRAVLVENLRIYNSPTGIFSVGGSNNSFIGNYFDKSGMEIQGNANHTGDLLKHNTLINASVLFDYNPNGTDIITENNFVNSAIFLGLSNAPLVDKNYWSNYTAKYPDAKELDNSGLWGTPYVYGAFQGVNSSIDYHPLVNPVTDFEIADFSNLTLTQTTPLPTASPTPTSGAQTINPALIWVILIRLPAAILVVAVIFKRKSLFKKK